MKARISQYIQTHNSATCLVLEPPSCGVFEVKTRRIPENSNQKVKQRGGKGGGARQEGTPGLRWDLQRWPGWLGVREELNLPLSIKNGHISLWNSGIPMGERHHLEPLGFLQTCALFFKEKRKKPPLYLYIYFIYIIYRECSWELGGGQGASGILGAEGIWGW